MQSNSSKWAKSAVDLVHPFVGTCQCYSELVFCGYNVTYMQQNERATFSLWPSSFLDATSNEIKGATSPCDPISPSFIQDPYKCKEYGKLRAYILSNIESQYTNLEQTIVDYRRRILFERNMIDEDDSDDTNGWAIIGLAQRSSRRVWLNLSDVIDACNSYFLGADHQMKVVCIEVNVEHTSTPYEQFTLHRSLDALIGVHGAQMTQGLFLRPRAHILELLPWIPVSGNTIHS